MKILVINCGSSSLKFDLIDTKKSFTFLAKGHIDGLNLKSCLFNFKSKLKNFSKLQFVQNHKEALNLALKTLLEAKVIKNYTEIEAVGHRVVHGGEQYKNPTLINKKVIEAIKKLCKLAPLHNPANLSGILACKSALPNTPHVAIFDTAFHQTMPEKAFIYGIPYEFYKKHSIRRYGFHGTNHKYVTNEAIKLLNKKTSKIISCHLGNGSSITASISGKSIDTSMGLTPLEGIIMGTRSGSIDPAIIFHLERVLHLSSDKIYEILNNKSGLLGISQISSDMRDIYAKYKQNNRLAILTIELLSYQIAKYIGGYAAALNGLDAIIFTGGLGEKAFYVRDKVCKYFGHFGLKLDTQKNQKCDIIINHPKSKIKVFVIPANEEKQIAIETEELLNNK